MDLKTYYFKGVPDPLKHYVLRLLMKIRLLFKGRNVSTGTVFDVLVVIFSFGVHDSGSRLEAISGGYIHTSAEEGRMSDPEVECLTRKLCHKPYTPNPKP